jgi:septal ring factor EnvC (AmiA/AmiB activator)
MFQSAIAALKALIPSLITITSNILPIFKTSEKAQAIAQLQSQIAELQTALTSQGQALQDLSKELEKSFTAIAASLEAHEKQLKQQRMLVFFALGIAIAAIALAIILKI